MPRLAIIATHPIQYYAPWYAYLHAHTNLSLRVFYLWNPEGKSAFDLGFAREVRWDVPLLSGYHYEFIENVSSVPGPSYFFGLNAPALRDRILAYRPDAVLLTAYRYFSTLSFILGWNARTPLLFRGDSHRIVPRTGVKEWFRQQGITALFRKFSAALYVGATNYDYFRMHGISNDRLFFSPHAIDQARFTLSDAQKEEARAKLKEQLAIPAHHQIILYAGKLQPGKGLLDLLKAFTSSPPADTTLVIVGSGILENAVQDAVSSSPLVKSMPFQNQSVLPEILALGDVLVLPSISDTETWGLIVNEAMVSGQGIIVSDRVGCHKELVQPEQNGLVFQAGNTEELSRCLHVACANPERLRAWGRKSKEIVSAFTYENTSKGLLDALQYVGIPASFGERPVARGLIRQ